MAKAKTRTSSKQTKSSSGATKVSSTPTVKVGAMATPNAALGKIPVSLAQLQDVHPDTVDFRDKMYVPTLVEVPVSRTLQEYLDCFKKYAPGNTAPILNQGQEGACTGFGLAAVANYLLWRRQIVPDGKRVSPRMIYEMARRYDEWPGEKYSGSSARGAMMSVMSIVCVPNSPAM